MIRSKRYVTETCSHCKRPGWKHENRYSLRTEEEQMSLFGKAATDKSAPEGAENLWVGCGSSIHETVKEAKELALTMKKTMAFMFNEFLVVVKEDSDVDKVVAKWWMEIYGETQEETFKRR